MLRVYFTLILNVVVFFTVLGQTTCIVCPASTPTGLTSTYPTNFIHSWVCTNGFTSSQRSPSISPAQDVTCTLTVQDLSGCSTTSSIILDVCECGDNTPCVSGNYNQTTNCIDVVKTGVNSSPIATDVVEYRTSPTNPWLPIAGPSLCGCAISDYINTDANVSISGGNFAINLTGLTNRCQVLSIDIFFQTSVEVVSKRLTLPSTSTQTTTSFFISPAEFNTIGNYATLSVLVYTMDFKTVINEYSITYNNGGLLVGSVAIVKTKDVKLFKPIQIKRAVTYSDNCSPKECIISVDIPNVPPNPCANLSVVMSSLPPFAPYCTQGYLYAVVLNATPPTTITWVFGNTTVGTGPTLCKDGLASGLYIAYVNSGGCTTSSVVTIQAACTSTVSLSNSGGIITATYGGCTPSTIVWEKSVEANNYTWTVIAGQTTSTLNTGGEIGDYRIRVTCSNSCVASASIRIIPVCTPDVRASINSQTLTATVTNCNGSSIQYRWSRLINQDYVEVRNVTKTDVTDSFVGDATGTYRVIIICNGCVDSDQISFVVTPPCPNFAVVITSDVGAPNTSVCRNTPTTYFASPSGIVGPITAIWRLNGNIVSTATSYTYIPSSLGTFTLSVTILDGRNCTAANIIQITVTACCAMSVTLASASVCLAQEAIFTPNVSSGTGPYTYTWTSKLGSNPTITQGTGSPKSITFYTAGTYTITVIVMDVTGCTATTTTTMVVTNCSTCNCVAQWNAANCQLTLNFSGTDCSTDWYYEILQSPTGNNFQSLMTGVVGTQIILNPVINGVYRAVLTKNNCTTDIKEITVNCTPTCNCNAGSLSLLGCALTWTDPCGGYTSTLERLVNGFWTYVTQTKGLEHVTGIYRVVYARGGCVTVTSSELYYEACCNCIPTINANGCVVTATFSGTLCSAYTYQLQYSLTGLGWTPLQNGAATTSTVITQNPAANGTYRLVMFSNTCQSKEVSTIVTCVPSSCTNSPTVNLNGISTLKCGLVSHSLTGNTFGGSATSVTLTHNGVGSLNISSSGVSPYNITYTPAVGDLNNDVIITVTSNNPLGAPCVAVTKNITISYKPIVTPVITSSNSAVCTEVLKPLTATPIGGTWTIVGGTGVGFILNGVLTGTSAGTITVRYTYSQNGCIATADQTITINPCPCQCDPTLVRNSCSIDWTICNGFVATLEKFNGSTWVTISSPAKPYPLPLSTEFSYDGYVATTYRVKYTKFECTTTYSNEINVSGGEIVTFTNRNSSTTPLSDYIRDFFGFAPSTDIDVYGSSASCLPIGSRIIYTAVGAGGIPMTSPNSVQMMFQATENVSWDFNPLYIVSPYMSVITNTSRNFTLKLHKTNQPPPPETYTLCGVAVSTLQPWLYRLRATNSCGVVVFETIIDGTGVAIA